MRLLTRDTRSFLDAARMFQPDFGPVAWSLGACATRFAKWKRSVPTAQLNAAGFQVHSVPLDAIEAGWGSSRCCIGGRY